MFPDWSCRLRVFILSKDAQRLFSAPGPLPSSGPAPKTRAEYDDDLYDFDYDDMYDVYDFDDMFDWDFD